MNRRKYHWKHRFLFIHKNDDLDNYLQQKKRILFQNNDIVQNNSLLSALPEPWLFKDIRKAAERILHAINQQEAICIFADYDVDGTSSCAMLKHFFADLNYNVDIYIPDRLNEGYGLNIVGVKKLYDKNIRLIITVDNGIAAIDACDLAQSLGIDIIITDHHDIPPILPNAFATLNPKQKDCLFPYKMLAGVGVAFYLIIAIRSLFREKNKTQPVNLKQYLDFVAIGTIADMAPLNGVNHILCRTGLSVLKEHIKNNTRLGLRALLQESGWKESDSLDEIDIGFKIGPRLNAAGRLGTALKSVEILTTKDQQKSVELAKFLQAENTDRQQLEKKYTAEAIAQVEDLSQIPDALVLYKEDWHPGVVGLVATRVLDKFYKPTLVFGNIDGKLKGSGRSTHSFDLFAALNAIRHEFISFGGHFHAVGLTILPEKLEMLKSYLNAKAQELILDEDKLAILHLDGEVPLKYLTDHFLKQLENFEPYGIENPRCRWLVGPAIIKHIKRIGKDYTQGHAKVLLIENDSEHWVTVFNLADDFEEMLNLGLEVQAVVEAKLSSWNGRITQDIKLIDYCPIIKIPQHSFNETL